MTEFKTFSDFLQMGGYGAYVWSAYGISVVVIAINIIGPLVTQRQVKKAIKQTQCQQTERRANPVADISA